VLILADIIVLSENARQPILQGVQKDIHLFICSVNDTMNVPGSIEHEVVRSFAEIRTPGSRFSLKENSTAPVQADPGKKEFSRWSRVMIFLSAG
jgi:hypothetical protein